MLTIRVYLSDLWINPDKPPLFSWWILETAGKSIYSKERAIVPKNRACHLNPTVRKVSSGGSELIPFVIVTNLVRALEKIRSYGVEVVGADQNAEESYSDIDLGKKVAFVIGSEDKGLKRLTSKNCDKLVKIDMPGKIESLNTSVSASILIFEYLRKNRNNF